MGKIVNSLELSHLKKTIRIFFSIIFLFLVTALSSCYIPSGLFFADPEPDALERQEQTMESTNKTLEALVNESNEDELVDPFEESVVEDTQVFGEVGEEVPEGTGEVDTSNDSISDPDTQNDDCGPVVEPVSRDCSSGSYCILVYPYDIRYTCSTPDEIIWANTELHPAPANFSISYSEGTTSWYEWRWLREEGDWIRASSSGDYSSIGVQIFGDSKMGWASVSFDGSQVWSGNATAFGDDGYNHFVYIEVSGISPGQHTLTVTELGIDGGGGGISVPILHFGYRR